MENMRVCRGHENIRNLNNGALIDRGRKKREGPPRYMEVRSPGPRTEYKTPLSPKYTPKSSPKTKIRKKNEKYTKMSSFGVCFHILVSERIRGEFWGVFWGSEGFCILQGAQEIANMENTAIRF